KPVAEKRAAAGGARRPIPLRRAKADERVDDGRTREADRRSSNPGWHGQVLLAVSAVPLNLFAGNQAAVVGTAPIRLLARQRKALSRASDPSFSNPSASSPAAAESA